NAVNNAAELVPPNPQLSPTPQKESAVTDDTPAFFKPPPPPAEPDRSAIYSAPVNRDGPAGQRREAGPGSVRLTAEQVEHARMSGISEVEYARRFLPMQAAKRNGSIQS